MPIKSYLAHPHEGLKEKLAQELATIPQCEVIPAKNENLLIVVTETESKEEEKELENALEKIQSMKLLAMVSGFNTSKQD
ncbi:hypothetical protein AUTU_38250 [Aureibacter tunicatorum]|nr:hypothetical protein AUTU_38250 [Aureibacter tunicatorum]